MNHETVIRSLTFLGAPTFGTPERCLQRLQRLTDIDAVLTLLSLKNGFENTRENGKGVCVRNGKVRKSNIG